MKLATALPATFFSLKSVEKKNITSEGKHTQKEDKTQSSAGKNQMSTNDASALKNEPRQM